MAERLQRGPLKPAVALHLARQITDALEAAHERGIVHRDLKPANIKITPGEIVKVLDFGLAKAMEQGTGVGGPATAHHANSPTLSMMASQAGIVLGTAAYMSPEQAKGANAISGATSSRSASCSMKCSPAGSRSRARPRRR